MSFLKGKVGSKDGRKEEERGRKETEGRGEEAERRGKKEGRGGKGNYILLNNVFIHSGYYIKPFATQHLPNLKHLLNDKFKIGANELQFSDKVENIFGKR